MSFSRSLGLRLSQNTHTLDLVTIIMILILQVCEQIQTEIDNLKAENQKFKKLVSAVSFYYTQREIWSCF